MKLYNCLLVIIKASPWGRLEGLLSTFCLRFAGDFEADIAIILNNSSDEDFSLYQSGS